jgi:hypothetical protein
MILRLWFRILGIVLLLLVLWSSAWAGFRNFNFFEAWDDPDWIVTLAIVFLSYGFVIVALWLIRGGPELIRKRP